MIYLQGLPFSFKDLKGWYNGYYASDGARLYNPWLVGNALTGGHLRSYWIKSGNKSSCLFLCQVKTHSFSRLCLHCSRVHLPHTQHK